MLIPNGLLSKLLASLIRNFFPKRPSGAPRHTSSNLYDDPVSFVSPSLFWGCTLLYLWSPKGGCCSISDDLSFSWLNYIYIYIWCSRYFCIPPSFETVNCYMCGRWKVTVARYRIICLVLWNIFEEQCRGESNLFTYGFLEYADIIRPQRHTRITIIFTRWFAFIFLKQKQPHIRIYYIASTCTRMIYRIIFLGNREVWNPLNFNGDVVWGL